MNKEEAMECVNIAINRIWNKKKCNEILDALEQEPCDDAINRQAVLDYISIDLRLDDEEIGNDVERQMELERSYRYIKSLPPVHPKQRTGRWEKVTAENEDGSTLWWYACSECRAPCAKTDYGNDYFSDYCPNCGAKMQEVDE